MLSHRRIRIACVLGALVASGVLMASGTVLAADTPRATQALRAPPDARVWTIMTVRGKAGSEAIWTDADGMHRSSMLLKQSEQPLDHAIRLDRRGLPRSVVVSGARQEEFRVVEDAAHWRHATGSGQAPWKQRFYVSGAASGVYTDGAIQPLVALLDALLAEPTHELPTLPSGRATLELLTTVTVERDSQTRKLTAWLLGGLLSNHSYVMWVDEQGDFFAYIAPVSPYQPASWVPQGWEGVLPTLQAAQANAIAAHSQRRATALMERPGTVVFENATIYDAASNGFIRNMSVAVANGKIVAVGPAGSIDTAPGSRRVDGLGKTLLPGLWDMHGHLWTEDAGVAELSVGVTAIREMSNYETLLFDQIRRIQADALLGPRVFTNLAITGGQDDPLSRARYIASVEEGLEVLREAKRKGYHGMKIYQGVKPQWIEPLAAQAHRLGLTINGHLPEGMSALEAARAGFDDISHLSYLTRAFTPPDILALPQDDPSSWPKAVSSLAYFDPSHAAAVELLDTLARTGTAVDPTSLSFYEDRIVTEPGHTSPAYLPFADVLPALEAHAAARIAEPLPQGAGVSQGEVQAGFQGYLALVRGLHERGVQLFPGTDAEPLRLIRELELFVAAGMSIGDALETATDGAARFMGVGGQVGSIAPGMEADLILVDADVSQDIGGLRQLEWVMSRGRLIDADALRSMVGLRGRPQLRSVPESRPTSH